MPRELPGATRPEMVPRFPGKETLKNGSRVVHAEFDETDEEHERQIEKAIAWIDAVEANFAGSDSPFREAMKRLAGGNSEEAVEFSHLVIKLIGDRLMPLYRDGFGIGREAWREGIGRYFGDSRKEG